MLINAKFKECVRPTKTEHPFSYDQTKGKKGA